MHVGFPFCPFLLPSYLVSSGSESGVRGLGKEGIYCDAEAVSLVSVVMRAPGLVVQRKAGRSSSFWRGNGEGRGLWDIAQRLHGANFNSQRRRKYVFLLLMSCLLVLHWRFFFLSIFFRALFRDMTID